MTGRNPDETEDEEKFPWSDGNMPDAFDSEHQRLAWIESVANIARQLVVSGRPPAIALEIALEWAWLIHNLYEEAMKKPVRSPLPCLTQTS